MITRQNTQDVSLAATSLCVHSMLHLEFKNSEWKIFDIARSFSDVGHNE
jgi:hypothetical protein